jgi:hypothetical protein
MKFKPVNEGDHPACEAPMSCEICMSRCWIVPDQHHFENGENQPCECGKFKNIKEEKVNEI